MHVKAKIRPVFESSSSSVTAILINSTKFLWLLGLLISVDERINCTSLHYDPRMWSETLELFEFMLYVATPYLCKICSFCPWAVCFVKSKQQFVRFFSPSYVFLLLFQRKSVMAATSQDVCKFVELLCHVCVMPCLMKVHRTIGIVSASCFYSSQTLEIHLFSQNIGCNLCTFLSL